MQSSSRLVSCESFKMNTAEEHKLKFNDSVWSEHGKKAKNSRMLTKEQYKTTVMRLTQLENPMETRTLADFNMMRRFSVVRVELNHYLTLYCLYLMLVLILFHFAQLLTSNLKVVVRGL